MAANEKAILSDPAILPDETLLRSIIGEKMEWWKELVDHTRQNYPAISEVWRYYNDGKQWLFRLLQKKETIFWCSLVDDTFRITFYFTDKFEPAIIQSLLPAEVINGFITSKRYGKIRGITIRMENPVDIESVRELTAIKLKTR